MHLPAFNLSLFVTFAEWFYLLYFLGINFGYLTLSLLSFFNLRNYLSSKVLDDLPQIYTGLEPPVSILVPAYNEEAIIAASLQSMLQMGYPAFEIIVINDGSSDATMEVLKQKFGLVQFPEAYRNRLQTQPVKAIYQSTEYENLRVVDKFNGGKSDSLNAGINASRYPLFCVVDADTVMQRDSLQRIVHPFLEDQRVVAVGGTLRIANGCKVKGGFLEEINLPGNPLALMQIVEYLRAFLFGRLGWSAIGALLIISGAFGVFRKEAVVAVGGYRSDTVGEDMDLVVRLHRQLRRKKEACRIVFLPDPVAWTEAPEDLITLANQRARWQRGLAESLFGNLGLMFSRNGGAPGWIAMPFMLFFELLGPVIEVSGYLMMGIFYWLDYITWPVFLIFLFATIGLGLLLSLTCLLLEEMSFHIYERPRHLILLILAACLENLGFRQLNSFWRLLGLFRWLFTPKGQWGKMKRTADWQQERVAATKSDSNPDD